MLLLLVVAHRGRGERVGDRARPNVGQAEPVARFEEEREVARDAVLEPEADRDREGRRVDARRVVGGEERADPREHVRRELASARTREVEEEVGLGEDRGLREVRVRVREVLRAEVDEPAHEPAVDLVGQRERELGRHAEVRVDGVALEGGVADEPVGAVVDEGADAETEADARGAVFVVVVVRVVEPVVDGLGRRGGRDESRQRREEE
ncbi:hypothetical protein [Rubrivirga marina]|uniref:Uncharacterized protein n=1 Tax=Rubrivirga marina TaxID=1196024 RepID=A0A271J448_9BACT|nr:hypothetical protein [Rubrivirga marina]PAP78130.1 hypothetical protein BSZ37_17660 [Rubrivirga marina]